MTAREKRNALILLVLAGVATIVLVIALPHLELRPGLPVPDLTGKAGHTTPGEGPPVTVGHADAFIKMLLATLLSCGVLYVFIRALWSCKWRDLWSYLRQAFLICLVASGLPSLIVLFARTRPTLMPPMRLPPLQPVRTAPLGAVPSLLLWSVGGVLLAVTLGGAWWLFRERRQSDALARIGAEAERAWQAVRAGGGLRAAIMACYRQMSEVLAEVHGLQRDAFVTAAEFETLLTGAGVPGEPVRQLTRLFERVRYGRGTLTSTLGARETEGEREAEAEAEAETEAEAQALACLQAIVTYCRTLPGGTTHE